MDFSKYVITKTYKTTFLPFNMLDNQGLEFAVFKHSLNGNFRFLNQLAKSVFHLRNVQLFPTYFLLYVTRTFEPIAQLSPRFHPMTFVGWTLGLKPKFSNPSLIGPALSQALSPLPRQNDDTQTSVHDQCM